MSDRSQMPQWAFWPSLGAVVLMLASVFYEPLLGWAALIIFALWAVMSMFIILGRDW